MRIEWLQARHVRNLTDAILEPAPHLNVISGPNASGKTSLLEAIHTLARGRSFRSPRITEVIQWQQSALLVTARLRTSRDDVVMTGLEKGRDRTLIKYNGEQVNRISDQARNLPLILLNPDSSGLVTGDPKGRRHWLDWEMFHVEPAYLDTWRNYHRALRHRNSLLRQGVIDASELSGWERAMADHAGRVTAMRREFIQELGAALGELERCQQLPVVVTGFDRGWPEHESLENCLARGREGDRRAGYTRHGLHRADLTFSVDAMPVSSVCSRGEIKQFVLVLAVAVAAVFTVRTGEKAIFLVDDFASELDRDAQDRMLSLLDEGRSQVFVTTTDRELWQRAGTNAVMFHVERGKPMKMVE